MAQLDVEKKDKNNNDWWKWLLGILVAIAIIWWIVESMDNDEVDDTDDIENIDTETTGSLDTQPIARYNEFSSKA